MKKISLFPQQFTGKLDNGVLSACEISIGLLDVVVWLDAELARVALSVVHGYGREADAPAVGQAAVEGHAGTATRMVTHKENVRERFHIDGKLVGSAKYLTIGEYNSWLVPAEIGRGFEIAGFASREVIVARSRLVLIITYEGLLLTEAGGELLGIGEHATAVVADVDDEAAAEQHVGDDLVEVSLTNAVVETLVSDVADVVVEDFVVEARGNLIVGAHVAAQEGVAEVGRVVLIPRPIASEIVGCAEVHVSVAQFAEHIGEHLEELLAGHTVVDAHLIFIVHLLPVQPVFLLLIIQEAVVLVDNLPQGLKVALWCIVEFFLINAGRKERDDAEPEKQLSPREKSFHNLY